MNIEKRFVGELPLKIVNQYFIEVVEMNEFEKIKAYHDDYALLNLRKQIWKVKTNIIYLC